MNVLTQVSLFPPPLRLVLMVLFTGDDLFWETVNIRYGATSDLECYNPQQVTIRNNRLVITMDSTPPKLA